MERPTLGGFLHRLAAPVSLLVASCNPRGYSGRQRIAATWPKAEPLPAIAGPMLLATGVPWSPLESRVTGRVVVDAGEHH